jgi:indole-3-glycerol phosphate synthase
MAEDFLSRIVAHKKEEVMAARKRVSLAELRQRAEQSGPKRDFMKALQRMKQAEPPVFPCSRRALFSKAVWKT